MCKDTGYFTMTVHDEYVYTEKCHMVLHVHMHLHMSGHSKTTSQHLSMQEAAHSPLS